jgi:Protein of unknown function (DUF559)
VYATKNAVQWAEADQVRRHLLYILATRATAGPDAIASYQSAAVLHRLDLLGSRPVDRVTLTVPPSRRWERPKSANVVFHSAKLPSGHVGKLYQVPVTTAARTVADLARTVPFTDAVVLADSALHQEKATKAELNTVLGACAGWPGVRQARRVVEFADERAESPLESAARVVFDQFGLEPPELQAAVFVPDAVFRVDFYWPAHRVVAEGDGLRKYSDRAGLIRQFERDRLLRDAGYQVVHFTWAELFKTPEAVVGRIRRAVTAARPY